MFSSAKAASVNRTELMILPVINARDPFNAAKSHAIERHFYTEDFDLYAVALRLRVFSKLATAIAA
ncbi:MAG: hypothetical protein KME05_02885 [Gloeocapsa sp. UFS-A4-WI-NPMV-4B04]|jgi:hypothetical protein|nr:hypothetical protein [Gloeocapsa sp. UFS-A4-WI-NPMV-4B04]